MIINKITAFVCLSVDPSCGELFLWHVQPYLSICMSVCLSYLFYPSWGGLFL